MDPVSKKKLLIRLTIIELVFIVIVIATTIATFDFSIAVATDALAEPWIGENPTPIEERYNVPLMNGLSILGELSLFIWGVVNITRFFYIKKKYKIMVCISVTLLILAFVLAFKTTIAPIILAIVAAIFLIYSHKLDKIPEE